MASLTQALWQKPDVQTKSTIASVLFEPDFQPKDLPLLSRYFTYYERELALLSLGKPLQLRQSTEVAARTHADILLFIQDLRANGHLTKREVRELIRARFPKADDISLDRCIDLSLRLWLMLNIRELRFRLQTPQIPVLRWADALTLNTFLKQRFPTSRWQIGAKDSRLHPSFTAAFMVEICGLHLEWTDCLADHLRLDRRQKIPVLRVFSDKNFLRYHLNAVQASAAGSPRMSALPESFLMETIQSLNLLFPQWDPETNKLLKAHQQTFQQQGPYDGPPTLNLIEFDHWRDRLLEVYEVVFQSPPVSWAQLWRDRRNPQQFWTFWIALVILLLTLLSTAASIVQMWVSIK